MTEKLESDFVHLHVHSHYSLLNALPTPKELAAAAKADGQTALAITDNGALYGAIDFYKACTKEGVKPVIGLDAFLAPRTRFDKETKIDRPRSRLVLLAKNNDGYKNLIELVTRSFVDGFYYRPRIDEELLTKLHKNLVAIIPSFAGEPAQALKDNDTERAAERLDWYKSLFGDDCYLEITHHPEILDHMENQARIIDLAKQSSTPLAAAHDVYYLKPEDRVARETMIKIQSGGVVEIDAEHDGVENFSFITQAEAKEFFKATPEALKNTAAIAKECNVEIDIGTVWYFPDYQIESGKDPDEELYDLSYKGISWRGLSLEDKIVKERLDYELDIIKMKGYAKYFLVVGDLLREARERSILTTIRGSVAGSLTTYALGITNVDPLDYQLPFERFLNPERPSAPDIDMDFADNRRDEIIEYAKEKYGEDKVAQIGTFGTMMARAAVRDVARALGHPYATGDRIAKLIPIGSQGFPMTIDRALEIEPDLQKLYKQDSESREVVDLAKQIEGRVRHLGVHAAGVVIAPEPLNQFVPVQPDPKTGKYITQYEMHSVGEDGVGLLKFDFLGIKNLAILADAVKRVRKIHGVEIDIENIPLDDSKTFAMLTRGETMGLFQLNGAGATAFLKQLQPTSIHDINAMVALYRPGPMESIPQYIERKHNPQLISYLDPRLRDILDRSYGVVTYQDDVLMIARELAGYSWLEADMLRKAMGKKIPEVMEAEKEKLLKGFQEYGKLSLAVAEKLWKLIEPFAAYGFNKCLPAEARIVDATTGVPTTIAKRLQKSTGGTIHALDKNHVISPKRASRPFENGVKTVYRLTTRSGRVLKATGNHPLYTWTGWTELKALAPGVRIAVPRRIPEPRHPKPLKAHEATVLGYLLSEGNLCHPHGLYFYSTEEAELKDFIRAARAFPNNDCTIDRSKAAASVYVKKCLPTKPNTLNTWITKLGLKHKKATEKYLPDQVFQADNASLARLLGKLWQGDGCVSLSNQQTYYATSSEQLAHDVQHLLLRLNILSTIHTKSFRYRGSEKTGWTVVITSHEQVAQFAKTAGRHLLTKKKADLAKLVVQTKRRTNNRGRGTTDTVPSEVLADIRTELAKAGMTVAKLAKQAQVAPRLLYGDQRKRGFTRDTLEKIGQALSSPAILNHAHSDVFWDEVVAIKRVGRQMTYDLSVPGPENFLADDFFVHNSHAASYGRVAYQTAYMKANYPVEYMSAVLTADSGDTEKISEIIHECERMEIEVLPPDINESFAPFSVVPAKDGEEAKIRFGLTTIKNFGEGIAETIIEERKENGPYTSLADFLTRIHDRNLNKKSLEALVMTGALNRFGERGQLHGNIDTMLAFNKERAVGAESAQDSLFSGIDDQVNDLVLEEAPPATTTQKLQWEKELLGVYVSGHPLDAYKDELKKRASISDIKADDRNGIPVVTAGMIETVRELLTKKGDRMAFVQLSNHTDSIEMTAFPETFQQYKELLEPGACVAVKGKLNIRNDEPTILIERLKLLGGSVVDESKETVQTVG